MSKRAEDIAALIKQAFKVKNSKPDHCLDERWLRTQLIDQLNSKEVELVNQAINILVEEKFITVENRHGQCMVLSQKGYEEIYPIDKVEVIKKIGAAILNRFAETNSKVGYTIDNRWILHGLMRKLNPREIGYINDAIDELAKNGLVTANDNGANTIIALTQKGFNDIY